MRYIFFIKLTAFTTFFYFSIKAQSGNCNNFYIDDLIERKIDTLTIQCSFYLERGEQNEIIKVFISDKTTLMANVIITKNYKVAKNYEIEISKSQIDIFREIETMLDTEKIVSNKIGASGVNGQYFLKTRNKTKSYSSKNLFSIVKKLTLL